MINDTAGWLPLKWRRPCLLCTRVHHRIETLMACYLQQAVRLRREQESFALTREYRTPAVDSPQTTVKHKFADGSPLPRCILASGLGTIAAITALTVMSSWARTALVASVGFLLLVTLASLYAARVAWGEYRTMHEQKRRSA